MTELTQFQRTLFLFVVQDSKHKVGTQAFCFPACVVSSGGHAPVCWIWVHAFFETFRDLTGSLPKGMAFLLVEAEGIFQSQPSFFSLPALSSRMSTSAVSLSGGSCSSSPSSSSRDGFGPSGPVF